MNVDGCEVAIIAGGFLCSEEVFRWLEADGVFKKIVTQLEPFKAFYSAEGYRVNYYENNGGQPYCALVIALKMG